MAKSALDSVIAAVDDQLKNLAETLSTLKFAPQCRRVELRSPRSKAAADPLKPRKDSLLEQVFQEMKEREAALDVSSCVVIDMR